VITKPSPVTRRRAVCPAFERPIIPENADLPLHIGRGVDHLSGTRDGRLDVVAGLAAIAAQA
jgi:hypothetical protein